MVEEEKLMAGESFNPLLWRQSVQCWTLGRRRVQAGAECPPAQALPVDG